MLENLLKYHQSLVSQEFIDNLVDRINQQFRIRHWVLGIFTCLGLVAGMFGIMQISNISWLEGIRGYFSGNTPFTMVSFSLLIVGFVTFMAWILNDEFEAP